MEDELLVSCIGAGVDRGEGARLNRLTRSQWDNMVGKSVLLGLGPLLAKRLRTAGARVAIPPAVRSRLREAYIGSAAANLGLYRDLSDGLAGMRRDGVAVIVLKGAFLAEAVYGDIALRPMSDIDLLVRPEDLARAETSLLSVGYARFRPWGRRRDFTLRGRRGAFVEIHRNVARSSAPFRIDLNDFWDRARPATIADVETLALCPEDLILHVCVHASHSHKFGMGLRPLCDICETVRHYGGQIDWNRLRLAAEQYGASAYVYYPLLLAERLLGAGIPAETLVELKPGASDPKFVERLEGFVLDVTPMTIRGFGATWDLFHAIDGSQGIRSKMASLLQWVFPPMAWLRRRYNLPTDSRLALLYYPVWVLDQGRRRWRDMLHWVFRTRTADHLLSKEKAKQTIEQTLEAEQQLSSRGHGARARSITGSAVHGRGPEQPDHGVNH